MDATTKKRIQTLKTQGKSYEEITKQLKTEGVKSSHGKAYSIYSVRAAGMGTKKKATQAKKAAEDCDDCADLDVSADLLLSGLIRTGSAERAREALRNALLLLG